MKKILFLITSVLSSMSLADDRESSYIYKCMQALRPVTKKNVYEIPERTTIVAMFKENFNGMYAREDESSANEGVISSGALLIEKKSLTVCPLDWSPYNSEPIVFKIKDTAGSLKLRFEYGKKNAANQPDAFSQESRLTLVSAKARGLTCSPVSEAEKPRAQALLKKMILSALREDIATKGFKNYKVPIYCQGIVGITSKDITNFSSPTRAPAVVPKNDTAEGT
jgi:hypothetical protein